MLYVCAGTLLHLLRYQFNRYGDIYSLHTVDQKIKHIPFRREFLPRVNDDSVVIHRLIRVVVVKDSALAAVAYLH